MTLKIIDKINILKIPLYMLFMMMNRFSIPNFIKIYHVEVFYFSICRKIVILKIRKKRASTCLQNRSISLDQVVRMKKILHHKIQLKIWCTDYQFHLDRLRFTIFKIEKTLGGVPTPPPLPANTVKLN